MAYKTAFYFEFESDNGTAFRLDIKKNNYTGTAKKRNLGRAPQLKLGKNGAVNGSSLDIWAECTTDGEFAVLYTSSPYEYLVELRQGSTVIWQGYVSPELYSEPDIAPPYDVNIVATDGLGELKQYTVESDTLSGRMTLHDVFMELLSPARTVSSVRDYIDIGAKPSSGASQIDILDCEVDMGHLEGETYYDALQRLLDSLHATIRIDVGTAVLIRENNAQAKARTSALTSSWWPVGQLSSEIRPAKKKVSLISEDKMRCILDNPDMGYSGAYWSVENHGILPTWRPAQGSSGPCFWLSTEQERGSDFVPKDVKYGAISQVIAVGSERTELQLSVKAECFLPVVGKAETLSLIIRTTSGSPLYLREESTPSRTNYVWTNEYSRIDIPFEGHRGSGYSPLEHSFTFQTIANMPSISVSVFPRNDFDMLNIRKFSMGVYHLGLTPVLQSKGLVEILKINNGARGALDDVSICLNGREPEAYGGLAAAMYGTLMNDQSSPIATVYTSEHGRLSLMQTIARDYAMSVALPRLQKKGVLNVPAGQRPPLIGFDDYLIETYSWNLVAAELDLEMVHFPAAQLTVESEVIKDLPKDYTGGGTGSSSGGGGGGTPITVDDALSDTSTNPVQNKVVTAAINERITEAKANDKYLPRHKLSSGDYCAAVHELGFFESDDPRGEHTPWNTVIKKRTTRTSSGSIDADHSGLVLLDNLFLFGWLSIFGRFYLHKALSDADSAYLEWDEDSKAIKVHGNVYATGYVSSGGVGGQGGSSAGDVTCVQVNGSVVYPDGTGKVTLPDYPETSDVRWNDIVNKPAWIGDSKPSYSFSEIGGTLPASRVTGLPDYPDLSDYYNTGNANRTDTDWTAKDLNAQRVVIAGHVVEYDAANNAFKFNGNVYATGFVSAGGTGGTGGASGGIIPTEIPILTTRQMSDTEFFEIAHNGITSSEVAYELLMGQRRAYNSDGDFFTCSGRYTSENHWRLTFRDWGEIMDGGTEIEIRNNNGTINYTYYER